VGGDVAFLLSGCFCQSTWSLRVSISFRISFSAVYFYMYEESSVDHRTVLGVIEVPTFSVLEVVRQARLILLILTTKLDLQDLSYGESGLTSLLPCLVPEGSLGIR